MSELARVGRGNARWGWIFTLAGCFVVVMSSVLWLTDEVFRGRYVHREYHGSELAGRDLRGVYLRWSDLRSANLAFTDLRHTDLRGAVLFGADFAKARLENANLAQCAYDSTTRWPTGFSPSLHGARLLEGGADCSGVFLSSQRLTDRDLRRVNLRNADLTYTELPGTDLRNADLRGASLWGADLRGCRLTGAKLSGARYDAQTRWPANVNPQVQGAVLAGRR